MVDEQGPNVQEAPGWRKLCAGLIDAAISMGVTRAIRRGSTLASGRYAYLAGLAAELARKQLRSPGQRLMGLRTVDRRTGARMAWWRVLAVAGFAVAGRESVRRLSPPPNESPERPPVVPREAEAIRARHAADPQARQEAMDAYFREHGNRFNPVRSLGPLIVLGLLGGLLRRRLAPTAEVRVEGG